MQNPFSYSFGIKPKVYVPNPQFESILEEYNYNEPTERALMITGVRGSGKTVMLSEINEVLSQKDDWFVIDLNRERDLLKSMASGLYDIPRIRPLMLDAKIDLSVFGIGLSIEKSEKSYDIEVAIEKMLSIIQKEGKKVLITIDEARKSDSMKEFCQAFQRFIRKKLPVYLVMTGLYKDIHSVKTMEGCTFLNRAPFEVIRPLDMNAIALEYKRVLGVSNSISINMAKLTNGYSFAFQVLGKLYFNKNEEEALDDLIFEYEGELGKYSYNIIWNELSETDKKIITTMINMGDNVSVKRNELMKELGFSSSMMNRYQARLSEKGVLNTNMYGFGFYSLALPRFGNYVKNFYID